VDANERRARDRRIARAEDGLRRAGHGRDDLLSMSNADLAALVEQHAPMLHEPVEIELLRARIARWPRERVLTPT
jgi:hypothetical protein